MGKLRLQRRWTAFVRRLDKDTLSDFAPQYHAEGGGGNGRRAGPQAIASGQRVIPDASQHNVVRCRSGTAIQIGYGVDDG